MVVVVINVHQMGGSDAVDARAHAGARAKVTPV
jgi:hypothetical protein